MGDNINFHVALTRIEKKINKPITTEGTKNKIKDLSPHKIY